MFITAVFIILSLFSTRSVSAQTVETASYQQSLRDYASSRQQYTSSLATYTNDPSEANLDNLLIPATALMSSRDQVMIAYISWLTQQIQTYPLTNTSAKEDFILQGQQFAAEFSAHQSRLTAVNNTISWYSADDSYIDLKDRFDTYAYQVFAQLLDGQLRQHLSRLEYLYNEQRQAIIDSAPDQITATSHSRELDLINQNLVEMQAQYLEISANLSRIRDKASYDSYKLQADLIISQLVRNTETFDSLWQR